jgi:hypothetical protein
MRISDDERQRAVDELARHLAAGRIDVYVYAERVEEVFAAETLADIDRARRDLPYMRIALPAGATDGEGLPARRRVVGGGGGWPPRLTLLVAAILVIVGVVVALTAQVAWVALLIGGWVLGVIQGRAARHRR